MIYAFDRELVYPKRLDAIIPTWLNHVMVWYTLCSHCPFSPTSHYPSCVSLSLLSCFYTSPLLTFFFFPTSNLASDLSFKCHYLSKWHRWYWVNDWAISEICERLSAAINVLYLPSLSSEIVQTITMGTMLPSLTSQPNYLCIKTVQRPAYWSCLPSTTLPKLVSRRANVMSQIIRGEYGNLVAVKESLGSDLLLLRTTNLLPNTGEDNSNSLTEPCCFPLCSVVYYLSL